MAIKNSANYKIGKQYVFEVKDLFPQLYTVVEKSNKRMTLKNQLGTEVSLDWSEISIPQKSKAKIAEVSRFNPPYTPKPPVEKVKPVAEKPIVNLVKKIMQPEPVIDFRTKWATLRKDIRDLMQKHNIENSLNFQSTDKEYIETLDKNLQKISKTLEILGSK